MIVILEEVQHNTKFWANEKNQRVKWEGFEHLVDSRLVPNNNNLDKQ